MNTYVKGELVTLSASFATRAGAAIDPAGVRLQVRDPAGTLATFAYPADPEIVKDAVGEYHVDFAANVVGGYCYRFDSSGTYQAAKEGSFEVEESCLA